MVGAREGTRKNRAWVQGLALAYFELRSKLLGCVRNGMIVYK